MVVLIVTVAGCGKPKPPEALVFRDASGRQLTERDLDGVTGTVQFELIGSDNVSAEATQLHEAAREAGKRGAYDEALSLLDRAQLAAPQWPYPVYDAAWTFLLKGDFEKAEDYYRKTDALAPRGFFMSKTALDSLRREREGTVKRGTYLVITMLEWVTENEKRRDTLRRIVKESPDLPVAWQRLASELDDASEKAQALDEGLRRTPDASTRAMLLINKALLLANQGRRNDAVAILGPLALDAQGTLEGVELAKMALKHLPKATPGR